MANRNRALRSLSRIAVILLMMFAAFTLVVWVFQERFVFLPPPVPAMQGRGAERVNYASTEGQQLFGFLISPSNPDSAGVRRFIVLFHGNGDLADSWMDWARPVADQSGFSVFVPEYRGYGGLKGKPTAEGIMDDARAAVGMLGSRYGAKPSEIVFYAHSIGSGIATQLAADSGARAVLLEAPITSVVEMGQRNFGPPLSFVLPFISRVNYAPVQQVRRIQAPVWVAIGERDDVVPPAMGRAVFEAARVKGRLLIVPAAGHGDVSQLGGEAYRAWVRDALAEQ